MTVVVPHHPRAHWLPPASLTLHPVAQPSRCQRGAHLVTLGDCARSRARESAGQQALDDLARSALARLDAAGRLAGASDAAATGDVAGTGDAVGAAADSAAADGDERRCAGLLRERLEAGLAVSSAGEHLRQVSNIFGPVSRCAAFS